MSLKSKLSSAKVLGLKQSFKVCCTENAIENLHLGMEASKFDTPGPESMESVYLGRRFSE